MPTLYTYSISPTELGCSVTADLSLTIVNGGAAQTGRQTILISVPTGTDANSLTAAPSGMSLTASQSTTQAGWAGVLLNGVSGWTIKLQGPGLNINQVLNFFIDTVAVNGQTGTVVLPIQEQLGSLQSSGALTLTKQFLDLAIRSFEPQPPYTSVPGQTTLTWTVQGGSYVILLPLSVKRPTQGSGPFSDQYQVSITDGPSTQFTLQLWTDNHQYVSANATVYASSVTATLGNSSSGAIDLTTSVSFTWSSSYAVPPLYLFPAQTGTMRVNPSGSTTFKPGALLTNNSTSMTFTLQASGWKGPATSQSVVFFNPVEVLYLRYANDTKSSVIWGAKNYIPKQTTLVLSGGVYTLTANGPGGPLQQQLGPVPALQVQVFTANPSSPNVGDNVTLSYLTANATGVTINGDAVPWDATTQSGSTTMKYTGPQILVVVATGNGGATLSSQLTLPDSS
jgi:hypothetical protein